MVFRSSFVVKFWAAKITVPLEYASVLRQAIDTVATELPQLRVSGYFFDDLAGQLSYQMNRVPDLTVGGGEAVYEEPALLISCRDEVDLHWLCMTLLVLWQEWATVYDKQRSVAYRLLTPLGEVREALYSSNRAH